MTNPTIRIHNVQANEIIDREMNAEEYAQHAADKVESVAKAKADEAEADAHATQKAALLARLGITADEAKLLIG